MRTIVSVAAVALCLMTVSSARAETPQLTELVDRHRAAVGGAEAAAQLSNAKVVWTSEQGAGPPSTIEAWFASGGRYREIARDGSGWSSTAFDGLLAYRINASTGHVRSPHSPDGSPIDTYIYATTWSQSQLLPLLDPDLVANAETLRAPEGSPGTVRVHVAGPAGLQRELTVTTDGTVTHDAVRVDRPGLSMSIERALSDLATFDGVRLPTTVRVTATGTIDLGGIERQIDREQVLQLQKIETATTPPTGFFTPGTPATPPIGHEMDLDTLRLRLAGQVAVGTDPESIRAGDLDGDGDLDLVTGDDGSTTWLVNDGTGSFPATVQLPGGGGSNEYALPVDLDADGTLELAVASTADPGSTLFILPNVGNGPGQAREDAVSQATGDFPESVTAADFDRDGQLDLAVAHNRSGDARVHFGNGDGTFSQTVTLDLGGRGENVATSDLNGDGVPDLLVVDQERLTVFIGQGHRTFAPGVTYAAGGLPFAVAAGDITGDGDADVLVGSGGIFRDTGSDDLALLAGAGDGSLQDAAYISAGGSIASVDLTDLDLDGDLDAVAASFGTHEAWILENRGGTLIPVATLPCGWAPVAITAADLDGNGRPDVAVANEYSNDVSLWLNVAAGSDRPAP
jgi:hypothetical protein